MSSRQALHAKLGLILPLSSKIRVLRKLRGRHLLVLLFYVAALIGHHGAGHDGLIAPVEQPWTNNATKLPLWRAMRKRLRF